MSKILVTGAAGFIGFHLVVQLVKTNHEIVGIDNINDYYDTELKFDRLKESGIGREAESWKRMVKSTKYSNYSFMRMNLEDNLFLTELFQKEKFDIVCNLAAQAGVRYSLQNPHAYISSNIVGFANILEACRNHNIKHLVYASSSSVYGNSKSLPLKTTDNVDNPISLYAATKKSNELMAYTYSYLYGFRTTGLRFFTVYGPWGRPDMSPYLFTRNIIDGNPIDVFNSGNMLRDFTYIDDIIDGMYRILTFSSKPDSNSTDPVKYNIYNIGNASPVNLLDYIHIIEKYIGKKANLNYLPLQPGDVISTHADVSDLIEDFDYNPSTFLDDGIKRYVYWFINYYDVK